jgi:hypothetical protein
MSKITNPFLAHSICGKKFMSHTTNNFEQNALKVKKHVIFL